MKRLFALMLAGFSISAHASYVLIDVPQCWPAAKGAHGACIQNNTGSVINRQLVLVEEIFYRDGGNAYGMYDITDLHKGYHLDFSYLIEILKKRIFHQLYMQ